MDKTSYLGILRELHGKRADRLAAVAAEYEADLAALNRIWVSCGNTEPPPDIDVSFDFDSILDGLVDTVKADNEVSPPAVVSASGFGRGALAKLVDDAIAGIPATERFSIADVRSELAARHPDEEPEITNIALTHVLRRLVNRNEIAVVEAGRGRRQSFYQKAN